MKFKNKKQERYQVQKLEELLKKIFQKLQVFEYANIDELSDELRTALEKLRK
jgi:type I restriction enzyme R subunit